jgi:hypothetical protein
MTDSLPIGDALPLERSLSSAAMNFRWTGGLRGSSHSITGGALARKGH